RFGIVPLPHFSPSSFEFHAVTVTVPCKLHIIVLYRPPGPLGSFLDEMDALLSAFPEDGTPVLLLGDFNLPLETSQASAFLPLLQSFDFTLAESPSTHKAGNQLDLIFTRNCALPNITNDLLDPNQSGFRAGHSTETALLAVTEALHGAKSQSLSSALLLLDLSAAFDIVDHRILLSSLVEMGISDSALTWFESYLADRSYQVPAQISACLADISAWMSTHHLKLNLGKTELLFLPAKGSPMIDASITVEGSIVSPSQSARSLGVTLDNQLCFSSHIAAITRTCRFSLHNIRRIRPFLTQEATELLVQDLVISCLQFLAGRPSGLRHQATATSPERCRSSGVQPAEVHPRHPSTLLSALAPHRSMHQIQVTGACFSNGQRYCSPIPPVTHHSLHTSQTPPLRLLW
ncbi:hypothetical protein AAFF_G00272580, partial [Aldrovandia affinis]